MKKTSKTVVFFGNERLATGVHTTTPTLKKLIKNDYKIAAVVVNQDSYKSRTARELEIETVAKANNIPLLSPDKPSEIETELRDLGAEIGVLAAYGKIVPGSIINIFPKGIMNIHPSLLPRGRGPTPIEQVILDGAKETGVSIMQLAEAMDAGDIFAQTKVDLTGSETKQQLADRLVELGSDLIIENLPGVLDDSIHAVPQDDSQATYNQLLDKNSGLIDWNKPAAQIEREVRAFSSWPKSRTQLGKIEVIVTAAAVTDKPSKTPGELVIDGSKLLMGCGDSLLQLNRLQPVSKSEMPAEAFLAGYRQALLG